MEQKLTARKKNIHINRPIEGDVDEYWRQKEEEAELKRKLKLLKHRIKRNRSVEQILSDAKLVRSVRKQVNEEARAVILRYVSLGIVPRKDVRKYAMAQTPGLDQRNFRAVFNRLIKKGILILTDDLKVYHFSKQHKA